MNDFLTGSAQQDIAIQIDVAIKEYFKNPYRYHRNYLSRRRARLSFYPMSKNLRILASAIALNMEAGRDTKLSFLPRRGEYKFVKRNLGWHNWYPWVYVRNGEKAIYNNRKAWSKYFIFPKRGELKIEKRKKVDTKSQQDLVYKIAVKTFALSKVFTFEQSYWKKISEVLPCTQSIDVPYVGVHIRRGDVISKDEKWSRNDWPIIPIRTFANEAINAANEYGIKTIFIATDSLETVDEFTKFCPGFEIIWNKYDRTQFFRVDFNKVEDVETYIALNPGKCDFYALSGLSDLYMLSKSVKLICTINSEFSKTAWYLALAMQKRFVPFTSLTGGLDLSLKDSIYLQ